MKLIRAHFTNFRLLKDLELNFSTSSEKPLTVIRAANESGKTTCQYALMWGLWGESALPSKKYEHFNIFPADLAHIKEKVVKVEIDFQTSPTIDKFGNQSSVKSYRLIRQLTIASENSNYSDSLNLYELTADGALPIIKSEAQHIINTNLPESLKDIFFTDGDRALSFIESNTNRHIKQRRVSEAIRALLSLDVMDATIRHLRNVSRKFESEHDNKDYAKELTSLNEKLEFHEDTITELNEEISDIETEMKFTSENYRQAREKVDETLKQGDKQKLIRERDRLEIEIKKFEEYLQDSTNDLRDLVQNETASLHLLSDSFEKAQGYLKNLKDRQQLPRANVPILEELLEKDSCFCGSSLNEDTDEGRLHRLNINKTIEASRDADHQVQLATELHFSVARLSPNTAKEDWLQHYKDLSKKYFQTGHSLTEYYSQLKELKDTIESIKDDALEVYRLKASKYNDDYIRLNSDLSRKQEQLDNSASKVREYKEYKDKIQKKLNKKDNATNKIKLAKTLLDGFENILDKINNDEIQKVSFKMNTIFLGMIGSAENSEELSSITKAELTNEFDIKVYGAKGHELNPDQDLNGASRRAITLAFILALTKVSEAEAPNVIDTPLGMMSGYVKQAVLNQIIKQGNQIILFLTHDEISGVEDTIDKYAGEVYTLTNTTHALMLRYKPKVDDIRILRCSCDHNNSCEICERIEYQEIA